MSWGNILFAGGMMLLMAIITGLATFIALGAGVPGPVVHWFPQVMIVVFALWFFRWYRRL